MSIFAGDNIRSVPPIAVNQTDAAKALLTLDEVAVELTTSRETVRRLCIVGRLPWVDVGTGGSRHIRRVLRSTLDAFKRNERKVAARTEIMRITQTFDAMRATEERW